MAIKSKIIEKLKEEEIEYLKTISPQERIKATASHSEVIRSFFYAGLKTKGFTDKQIDVLWETSKNG